MTLLKKQLNGSYLRLLMLRVALAQGTALALSSTVELKSLLCKGDMNEQATNGNLPHNLTF